MDYNPESVVRPLFVYYYFPPRGGVAVQRIVKFIKYLVRLGCVPTVLTSGARYETSSLYDQGMLKEVPPQVSVYRTRPEKLKQGQFVGRFRYRPIDRFLPWVLPAYWSALKIIKERNINVIFVTSPPHSQQIIGWLLKRKTGLPWVADFRDPWLSDERFRKRKTGLLLYFEELVERLVLKNADVVIGATPTTYESLRALGENAASTAQFVCLTNGYDPEDYQAVRPEKNEKLHLAYAGTLDHGLYSPRFFFEALNQLFIEHPALRSQIRVSIAGALRKQFDPMLREFNIDSSVDFMGFVSHEEAIRVISCADALLLFLLPVDGAPNRFILSSKTFEYLGSGRPIIAMVSQGDTADFLKCLHIGDIIDPTDTKSIAATVYRYLTEFKQGGPRQNYLPPEEFSRQETAKVLMGLFQALVNKEV